MTVVAGENSRLEQLQSWLTTGWEIEEPVLMRSAYYGSAGRVCAFEVVVNHKSERRVIALQDVPEVQSFLLRRKLVVLDVS